MSHPLFKIHLQYPYRTEENKSDQASLNIQVYYQMSNDQIIKLHSEYEFIGLEYLRSREDLQFVPPKYLHNQSEINENMREVLIDWLVEVS